MLSGEQIEEYNRVGAIVVADVLSEDEVCGCGPSPTSSCRRRAAVTDAQRDLRSRGQPHAGRTPRAAHQGPAPAPPGIRPAGAPSENPRRAGRSVGTGHPLRHRQAESEIGRLRRRRGVAPGLGLLPAHQRRPRRGRRDDGRHGAGERAAAGDPRQPQGPDLRSPRGRAVLRRHEPSDLRGGFLAGRSAAGQGGLHHRPSRARRSTARRPTRRAGTGACCCSSSAPPMPGRCSVFPTSRHSTR